MIDTPFRPPTPEPARIEFCVECGHQPDAETTLVEIEGHLYCHDGTDQACDVAVAGGER